MAYFAWLAAGLEAISDKQDALRHALQRHTDIIIMVVHVASLVTKAELGSTNLCGRASETLQQSQALARRMSRRSTGSI